MKRGSRRVNRNKNTGDCEPYGSRNSAQGGLCTHMVGNSYGIHTRLSAIEELQGDVHDILGHNLDLSEWGGGVLS